MNLTRPRVMSQYHSCYWALISWYNAENLKSKTAPASGGCCCWCWLVALYSFSHQFTFCIFTLQWDILCDVLRGWACTSPASPPSLGRDNNRYRINKLFCWSTTNLSATWYLIQTFLFRNFVVILVSTNPAPATAHCQRCQWMVILNILLLTSELRDHLHS